MVNKCFIIVVDVYVFEFSTAVFQKHLLAIKLNETDVNLGNKWLKKTKQCKNHVSFKNTVKN